MSGEAWVNWFGNQTCTPQRIDRAATEEQVVDAVVRAGSEGLTLRVAGAGHSLPPLVNTDGVVLTVRIEDGFHTDPAAMRAAVPAGWRIREILDPLWDDGLALANVGEVDTAVVAGAVSTGVHGTGVTLASMSASLREVRMVTAGGEVVDVSADRDPELLRAVRVSLGMLGVITRLTLDVVPAYDLHETSFFMSPEETVERWDELLAGHRHFSFFYLPNGPSDLYAGELPPIPPGMDRACFATVRDALAPGEERAVSGEFERRDRMGRILIYHLQPNYREIEFAVPFEAGKETFQAMTERFATVHPSHSHPVQVRFVAGDDGLVSPFNGGPRAVFSVSERLEATYNGVLADLEKLFYSKGGLPHWGKEHTLDVATLSRLQPGFDRFREIRRELDPDGIFLNPHLRELFV